MSVVAIDFLYSTYAILNLAMTYYYCMKHDKHASVKNGDESDTSCFMC